jgi:AI-2 transport protein TqsA
VGGRLLELGAEVGYPSDMEIATTNPGRGARFLLVAASVVIVIWGLREAQPILIPFLISALLAILCAPPVFWLQRHRVPSVLAVAIVVVALIAVFSAVGAVVGGSVNEFTDAVPGYKARINGLLTSFSAWLDRLPFEVPPIKVFDVVNPGDLMSFVGTGLKGLVSAFSNTVLVILTLVFMLLEAACMPAKIRLAFLARASEVGRFEQVTRQVQQYLAIKTALSLATGALIAIWVAILGLDFALVWGLLAFLLNYIPNLGSIIAAVPAILLALVQLGPGRSVLVLLGFVAVNMVIGNVLEPQLMGRRLGLSALVVFLSLVFWGWVWGPIGMFLSVPLTMVFKILVENSDDFKWLAVILDSGASAIERLRHETSDGEEGGDAAVKAAPGGGSRG